MLNRIISVKYRYKKLCVAKRNYLYEIAMVGTIWRSVNEWIVLNGISCVKKQYLQSPPCVNTKGLYWVEILVLDSNNWNHLTVWTPSHGRAKAGRPARIYVQQLCADKGCSLEDLPEAMDDREEWRERVREIHADGATWWWWWWW